MDLKTIQSILSLGENVAVEFKRCGNGIESDTYETVCSFLNRFGGDIFMGVQDDGKIVGKGTHQELLKTCQTYQEIAMSQLSQSEIEKTKGGMV